VPVKIENQSKFGGLLFGTPCSYNTDWNKLYTVAQNKRRHFTFLLVTNEWLQNFYDFGEYKLCYIKQHITRDGAYHHLDISAICCRSGITIFTARCTLVQSAVLRSHVVCPSVRLSVTLMVCDDIGWNSSKIISRSVSLGCLLSVDPNMTGLLQGEHPDIFARMECGAKKVIFGVQNL